MEDFASLYSHDFVRGTQEAIRTKSCE